MFAYCNNCPVFFKDATGERMAGILQDGATNHFGGSGWSSSTVQVTNATANSVHADTKENVWDRVMTQAKNCWEYYMNISLFPNVRIPLGTLKLNKGIDNFTTGMGLLLIYDPTPLNEIVGILRTGLGVYQISQGIKNIFGGG